jgi:pilus assembly protein Flp/PilA
MTLVDVGPEEGGLDAIRSAFCKLRTDEKGATAIEYGLIVALIGIAMVAALSKLGGGSGGMWTNLASTVNQSMAVP